MDILYEVMRGLKNGYKLLLTETSRLGFIEGREFRTFKEISFEANQVYIIKVVAPYDLLLSQLDLTLDSGSVKMTTYVGGTPTGSFTEIIPLIPKNNMSRRPTPYYTPVTQLSAIPSGGTLTGGTAIDIIRVVAANATAQQQSVGSAPFDVRGVGAGTYYLKFEALSGTPTGMFRAFFEEII